ncbi:MAG: hypothetical protein Q3993_08265, partial [Filifactor alocis]|nr:hypothetical protein [Filifactor alocis]
MRSLKKNIWRKLIAMVTVLTMVVLILPVQAFAEVVQHTTKEASYIAAMSGGYQEDRYVTIVSTPGTSNY